MIICVLLCQLFGNDSVIINGVIMTDYRLDGKT